jgi:hypothetical protein
VAYGTSAILSFARRAVTVSRATDFIRPTVRVVFARSCPITHTVDVGRERFARREALYATSVMAAFLGTGTLGVVLAYSITRCGYVCRRNWTHSRFLCIGIVSREDND